jgi:hypothetical protein
MTIQNLIAEFRREAAEDFVGLWEVFQSLSMVEDPRQRQEAVLTVVAELLTPGDLVLGDFQGNDFVPWLGNVEAQISRVRTELRQLGRDPDIGEIAWIADRGHAQ